MTRIMDFILNFIRKIILFWIRKPALKNTFNIVIKSNSGKSLCLGINPKWDIKHVKQAIAPQFGTCPERMRVILAGRELVDSIVVEECDLGDQSILHVVNTDNDASKWKHKRTVPNDVWIEDDRDIDKIGVTNHKTSFYIYCGTVCRGLQVGKLRVRCSACKSGAFTVDTDPKGWVDVLNPKRITGECEQNGCPDGAFGWAEFYFKCAKHVSIGESDTAIPLPLVCDNGLLNACMACLEIKNPVMAYPCKNKHVTCIDCFISYASSRLKERQFIFDANFGYTLPCPARCRNSLIDECNHFRLLDAEQFETYQKFAAEEYVLNSGGVLCPQPRCGAGIIIDTNCSRVSCVNGCGYVFCPKCHQGFHEGDCNDISYSIEMDTLENNEKIGQIRVDEASRVAIRTSTKPCPNCRTPTERSGGCMHMVCTRCNYDWCWSCQIKWSRQCMALHWFD